MPKVQRDMRLHHEVQSFVSRVGGVSRAAKELGLERTSLWRFCRTGCAIDRTRQAIASAMIRNKNATNASDSGAHGTNRGAHASLNDSDLKAMRAFCQKILAMIDIYERIGAQYDDPLAPEGRPKRTAAGTTGRN